MSVICARAELLMTLHTIVRCPIYVFGKFQLFKRGRAIRFFFSIEKEEKKNNKKKKTKTKKEDEDHK